MFSFLRQLKYPREFRVPAVDSSRSFWESTDQLIRHWFTTQQKEEGLDQFLRETGTSLWRMRNRLGSIENPGREVLSALRFLESSWDALYRFEVQVIDHLGEIITGGEAVAIISSEPTPGLTQEQVIETVKPTILFKGKMIQMGEVIVGQPVERVRDEVAVPAPAGESREDRL